MGAQTSINESEWIGATEAAQILKVSPKTVGRYADQGIIVCIRTPKNYRRFLRSTVKKLA
ncbi:helix-turn-helix domain-containing protein [Methanosarcina sp. 1.H.A.2.2]|uniref:helix-turn-helix domain-containing protein n=1 Tax=Methanosarcina sp. 1.H.A.2.2 TaxID=1483601 RepID=UPI00062193A5|nr:helix-turn-helix domain-containing protein [Methanosarcina sp. 1.H.A.2.2]KKH47540.1 hypothetical protein EO93_01465 [Methanosarcina sp. 1.H.A.2.2]